MHLHIYDAIFGFTLKNIRYCTICSLGWLQPGGVFSKSFFEFLFFIQNEMRSKLMTEK